MRVTAPLSGIRVVEMASIGPGPFCAMLLADLGAEVIRVERISKAAPESEPPPDPMQRGRAASIAIDLKSAEGPEVLLQLVETADVLVEGFRPGVMERLGIGPAVCLRRNPELVYGRMTGWGQDGPRASEAGHDIDYVAVAGALHPIGDPDRPPPPPLNLVADFGGGGMLLALGICAALIGPGRGTVIDAAMVDGVALLTAMFHGMRVAGAWSDERGVNLLDGGAPFYRAYEAADGRYVAVGALEPKFYTALLEGLGLDASGLPPQYETARWPELRVRFAEVFKTRTRDEWADVFAGTDACVAPVNDLGEAVTDGHMVGRGTFIDVGGVVQPAPAPRFLDSGLGLPAPARPPGADTDAVLTGLGFAPAAIARLRETGVVA